VAEVPDLNQMDVGSVSRPDISLQQGSIVTLKVLNETQPDTISVTAYPDTGSPEVIAVHEGSTPVSASITVPPGDYVLMATATWSSDPAEETPSGSIVYGYRISVE
jgi:hypothetical protein